MKLLLRVAANEAVINNSELHALLMECEKCRKSPNSRFLASGSGSNGTMFVFFSPRLIDSRARLMNVGEEEMLSRLLSLFDVELSEAYLTSLVKCPFEDASDENAESCIAFLRSQFRLIAPSTIVCFGEKCARLLITSDYDERKDHGRLFEKKGVRFFGTIAPTEASRSMKNKEILLSDLTNIFSGT